MVTRIADDGGPAGFLVHAMVWTPGGDLLDIRGVTDAESIELEDDEAWQQWPADQARELLFRHEANLSEQDLSVACTFIDPVLALYAQDQAGLAQTALDNQAPVDGGRFCGLLQAGHLVQQSERFGEHDWVAPAEHQREARG